MLWWDLFGDCLRDLTHAFSSIFLRCEHVTLAHVKSDFTFVLFDELCDHFICFATQGLSDGVIKDGDQVTVL